MKKKILFNPEAREQILEGAEILYKAVSTTLGPKGNNAVIEAYGEPVVTHDGVTVAKSIDLLSKDRPGVRVGIEMIKSSSSKTNDNVGDGTTSSTVLAYHLIEEGLRVIEEGTNPMILRKELDEASTEALSYLEELAQPVTTEKATIEVATISSENKVIGERVGKMYHKLGKDAMVTVELGTKPETEYEIVEGYSFDRGFVSPLMMTDPTTHTVKLENPAILVAHATINFPDVRQLIVDAYQAGHDAIVVVADDFKPDFIEAALQKKGEMEIIGIKAPGFGEQRPELMKDLAALCGTEAVGKGLAKDLKHITVDSLGTVEKLVASVDETVLTGGADVTKYIKELEARLEKLKGEFDREKMSKRIANLRAKVGNIRVGGNTEMEAEETKFLIDDAVAATEAALKDGIVPGGGTTYVEISRRLKGSTKGTELLKHALLSPFKVLMDNAGERSGLKLKELTEFGKGFDVLGDGSLVDLKEHGVIDPVLVIRQAITNATSVAGSALTTGVLIVNENPKEYEDDKEEE